jgi:plasmid stabilization system protein ParE
MGNSRLVASAESELAEAVGHYSEISETLARRFIADVRHAVALIEEFPEGSPVIAEGVRKRVMFEFPYLFFYRVANEEIVILAVAHQRRRPVNWRQRIRRDDAG